MKDRSHDTAMVEAFRKDPAYAAELMGSILKDGDQDEILNTLRQMTEAFGGVLLSRVRDLSREPLYYFASPYSHPNKLVKNIRYEATIFVSSSLTKEGFRLLEPIGMCHDQAMKYSLPTGYAFWKERDRGFIDRCDAVIVITLPGWETSEGVQDEIAYARSQGKKVFYISLDEFISPDILREAL